MTESALLLSRAQFAFTIGFHILWPAYTIGISGFIVIISILWLRTGRPVYRALLRFWVHLFALGFAMGVVTGVVMSYQIGTNWSAFAERTANVIGPFFTYEVLMAFFLEAGFVGVMLFGMDRVSPRLHFVSCLAVAHHHCRRGFRDRSDDLGLGRDERRTPGGANNTTSQHDYGSDKPKGRDAGAQQLTAIKGRRGRMKLVLPE